MIQTVRMIPNAKKIGMVVIPGLVAGFVIINQPFQKKDVKKEN